jgi:hypothetical protein
MQELRTFFFVTPKERIHTHLQIFSNGGLAGERARRHLIGGEPDQLEPKQRDEDDLTGH